MQKGKSFLLFLLLVSTLGALMLSSKQISAGISTGIALCLQSLIPSLFFFMIVSNVICNTRLANILVFPFAWIAKRWFRVTQNSFAIILLSLLGGYPVGAKLIGDKLRTNEISPQSAGYLLPLCVHCSPAFLISFVSIRLWNSPRIGVILFVSQLLACLCLAKINQKNNAPTDAQCDRTIETQNSPTVVLVESVVQAAKAIAIICSFVLVFCALFPLLDVLPLPKNALFFVQGFLEVTTAMSGVQGLQLIQGVIFTSLFTAFGGLCVFLQVFAMLPKTVGITFMRFVWLRLCYTALCVGFTWTGMHLFVDSAELVCLAPKSVPLQVLPYADSLPISIGLLLLATILLLSSYQHPPTILPLRKK